MTIEERDIYITELYEAIAYDLVDLKGDAFKYLIDEETLSLSCNDFILSFDNNFYTFVISFKVGEQAYKSAQIMAIILKYIESHEVHILEDSFFDKKNKRLLYGSEAVAERQLEILRTIGKEKCIICDAIYSKEKINETGICSYCLEDYNNILWC